MVNDAILQQLRSLGIDDALVKDVMSSVSPDPITGKIGVDAIMKYILESNNPQLKKVLLNGARLVEQQRKESSSDSLDWSSIDFNSLPNQTNVTWWLRLTSMTDGGTATHPAKYIMECMTYGNKIDSPRLVDKYKNLPTSDELLLFIRRCMAKPLPGLEPALPHILIIQRNLKQPASALQHFLDTLPSPFRWAIESEAASSTFSSSSSSSSYSSRYSTPYSSGTDHCLFSYEIPLSLAQSAKTLGNTHFNNGKKASAIAAYTDAIDRLMNAFRSDPNREKNREAEKLLAVCSSNRAAAHLLTGSTTEDGQDGELDPHEAWKDGEVAVRADPTYARGYLRISRAHELLNNPPKAKEAVLRGLGRTDLQDNATLVDRLILLQTDGNGLSDDEEEFLAWKELILVEDEASVKMMKGVSHESLWWKQILEHERKLREKRETEMMNQQDNANGTV